MAGKPTEARQNGQGIWLYNAERLLRFLLLQWWLQDICSTRLEAFAIDRAIAADPDLTLLGRLVASQLPTNLFHGNSYRLVVTPERALVIQQLPASFKLGVPRPLKAFQKMLGLMASAFSVLQLGLLHMRPLQYWLKPRVPPHAWDHEWLRVKVNQACVAALSPWKNHQWMEWGVPMGMVYRRKVVSTDVSNLAWGAPCDGKPAFGLWLKKEGHLHINCLEMVAICLGLRTFLSDLRRHHVLVRSDSMQLTF